MIALLILLALGFIIVASEYKWKGALLYSVFAGFIQDPLRKLSQFDSSYFAAISLICFLLTFFILKSNQTKWNLSIICWLNPSIITFLPIFFYLLALQSLNSLARFSDIRLTIVGALFYLIPLISLWVGYNVACDLKFMRQVIITYVVLCSLTAFTILLNLWGMESSLFKEVGPGIEITGTGFGYSGLWRTSEIAGWHLAAGACFSFILGMTESKTFQQVLYFLLSLGLSFLTVTTGRRKSLGLVIIFVTLFLLYYSFNIKGNKFSRAIVSFISVLVISFSMYGLVFTPETQTILEPFLNRSSTLTVEESQDRLQVQGIGAFLRGIQVAGPIGYGLGVGSNSGNTGIGEARQQIRSISYISEGGAGRLIIELGVIGLAIVFYFLFQFIVLYAKNFFLSRYLINYGSDLLVGLALFSFANLITFVSASQLYSDPFVLILIGICLGSFLAVPHIYLTYLNNSSKINYPRLSQNA
jgi:hypothetical protein